MKTEYYTPDVQEFHVGVSFEENWSTEGKDWVQIKIENAAQLADWMDTYAFDSTPENFRMQRTYNKKQGLQSVQPAIKE